MKKIKIKLSDISKFKKVKILPLFLVALVFGLIFVFRNVAGVFAATLSGGFVSLSDSRPSQTTTYTFDWDNITDDTAIKCIQIELDIAADGSGGVPSGLSTQGPVAYSAANSDFVPDSETWAVGDTSTNGTIKITNANGETPASATNGTVVVNGIVNGSTAGTNYFALFNTYSNENCSGAVDNGTIAFIYTAGQVVNITVDPSITFTVNSVAVGQSVNGIAITVASTSTTIPLGTTTVTSNAVAAHDLTVNTNATGGYTVYTRYTARPTYSIYDIDDYSGSYGSPSVMAVGTEAFGYTTEDTAYTQFQTNKYAAFTTSNAAIVNNTGPASNETTRVGYQSAVAGNTPAGNYETTVVLTATPTY